MNIQQGDYVTRISYNHDTIFKVINIKDDICYLKGAEVRLYADSPLKDLKKVEENINEDEFTVVIDKEKVLERSEFFYLPAKVLHIDSDISLSNDLLNLYKIREKAKIQKYINHKKKQKMSKI